MKPLLSLVCFLAPAAALCGTLPEAVSWLDDHPKIKVTVNGKPLNELVVAPGDRVRIEVSAHGKKPLDFKFQKHQLVYDTLKTWGAAPFVEYRVGQADLAHAYLDLSILIRESYGYDYPMPDETAVYRAQVHFRFPPMNRGGRASDDEFPTRIPDELPVVRFGALQVSFPDGGLTAEQSHFVKKAFAFYSSHALDAAVLDCTWSAASRDLPWSKEALIRELEGALRGRLLLVPLQGKPGILAHGGRVGFRYEHDYLYIGLNTDYLGAAANRGYFSDGDVPKYAAILGHEILHNFGYDHGSRVDDISERTLFLLAYENCLASVGPP